MKSVFKALKWLLPLVFLIFALFFYSGIHGHSFLGLTCLGLAGVHLLYLLVGLFNDKHIAVAKTLRLILSVVVGLGIFCFAVTEALIIEASYGDSDPGSDYVIVLGAKVNGTEPSVSLGDRIDAAYEYLKEYPDAVAVLSGGQGEDEDISEARCMYDQLTARGIDPDRLWLEEQATSTWENLQFSLNIIEEKTGARPQTVGLLSSEYHLFRAGLFAEACGVEAKGVPAPTSWISIKINYFMREVAGVWHYLIFGG